MISECLRHAPFDLVAAPTQREHTVDVGRVRSPAPALGLFVDNEVLLHRRLSIPVARRIAASVPAGTVSDPFRRSSETGVRPGFATSRASLTASPSTSRPPATANGPRG